MIDFFAARGPRLKLDESSVLDIGACIMDGVDLAPRHAIPDDGDPRIAHSLQGFLFTCGPDHIRHRTTHAEVDYPLHGSFSGHRADVRWIRPESAYVECRADIALTTAEGHSMMMERTWRIDHQTGEVSLHDRIINTSANTVAVFHMYHMNIGGIWLDDNVRLSGAMLENGGFAWRFGQDQSGLFCVPAAPAEDGYAQLQLGPIAALGGKTLHVSFDAASLPYLQIWRNQRAPSHVLGIEPVSHRWVPRAELEKSGEFITLEPGESRDYSLRFMFA